MKVDPRELSFSPLPTHIWQKIRRSPQDEPKEYRQGFAAKLHGVGHTLKTILSFYGGAVMIVMPAV